MADQVGKVAEDIRKTLEHAGKWEKKKTEIPGIYLVRMPKDELEVMLMFNPPDEAGNPMKRRGWYFGRSDVLESIRTAFKDQRLDPLIEAVERINMRGRKRSTSDEDVFQIRKK